MSDRPPGIHDVDGDVVARGYESRDLRIRPLLWIAAGFMVVSALLCGGLWLLYSAETSRPVASAGRRSVVSPTTASDAPPLQPQVGHESVDAQDLRAMRDRENSAFAGMGWRQDERTRRFVIPAYVVDAVRQRQAATQPTQGER